jgi:hypothetical protein
VSEGGLEHVFVASVRRMRVHATDHSWDRWVSVSRLLNAKASLTSSFEASDSCVEAKRESVGILRCRRGENLAGFKEHFDVLRGGGADFGLSIVPAVAVAHGRRVKPFRRLVQWPGGRGAARADRVGREHQ